MGPSHPPVPDGTRADLTAPPLSRESDAGSAASSSAGLGALARLVERFGHDALLAASPGSAEAEALREVVVQLCAEARCVDARRAELLVMTLHSVWPTIPGVPPAASADGRETLLSVLVSRCISEFYGPGEEEEGGA